jgi:excisionase family DNA binding protein
MQVTTTTESPEVLRPAQAARHFGVTTATIWAWCRNGTLSHVRATRRTILIRRADIEAFMRSKSR